MKENKLVGFSLVYFLSRALFLGHGLSRMFKLTGKDTWISVIIGTLLGIIIIYLICKLREKKNGKSLNDYLETIKGGLFIKLLIILLAFILILFVILILEVFAISFFLFYTPAYFIILPFIILLFYLVAKGMKVVNRISSLLVIPGIFLFIFAFFSLFYKIEILNYLPVLTYKTSSILHSASLFAILSSVPNFFLIDHEISTKNHIVSYLFAALSLLIVVITSVGVLGPDLTSLYRYPEYMILRKINVFNFIQNIENIIAYLWYFDIFIFLGVITVFLKKLLPIKHNKLILGIILFIIFYICAFILYNNYKLVVILHYVSPYIIISLFFIIIIPLIFKKKT